MEVRIGKRMENSEFMVPDSPGMYEVWQTHTSRYVFASTFVQDKVVLDVACGSGYGSAHMTRRWAKKVVGADISSDALEYALAHYRTERLEFVRLDAQVLPFADDSFDVVVSFETIEHLIDYENFISECRRILKDNGLFVCSTPNKEIFSLRNGSPFLKFHVKEFYPSEFHDLLSRHFSSVILYGQAYLSYRGKTLHFMMRRVGVMLSLLPKGEQLKSLITKLIYRRNRRVRLGADAVLDEVPDKRYAPALLQDSLLTPTALIAVATVDKSTE